jgi:hypothetical protein
MISHDIPIVFLSSQPFIPALTFDLERILRHLVFRHVDNSVDIEGDLLGVRGPALVAEAVVVFAVRLCGEGVVVGSNGLLEVLAVSQGILDLPRPSVSVCVLTLNSSSIPPVATGLVQGVKHSVSGSDIWQCHHRSRRGLPSIQNTQHQDRGRDQDSSYPEINLKVSTSSKLAISNLESDSHDVVAVQCLVEAFS